MDLRGRQITIRDHKTSRTARQPKPRLIPLTGTATKTLEKRLDETASPSEGVAGDLLVFPIKAGKPHDKDTLRHRFDRVKETSGLGDVTIHALRHTFGSNAVMSGTDLKTVAELMGHTSPRGNGLYFL